MKATPFETATDLPPIPFDEAHCRFAQALKESGLGWKPHVGCFVWDPKGSIEVSSPFPGRIYFILNLGHFLRIFQTLDEIAEKLIWLPTWHQALLLCGKLRVDSKDVAAIWQTNRVLDPGAALLALYGILLKRFQ
jgi:hypothetical protein